MSGSCDSRCVRIAEMVDCVGGEQWTRAVRARSAVWEMREVRVLVVWVSSGWLSGVRRRGVQCVSRSV